MLDLKQQVLECSVSQDQTSMAAVNNNNGGDLLKRCTDCRTTTTPLWRGGPAGPKSLCNACGIKYHKKRRALLGIEKSKVDKTKKKSNNKRTTTITSSGSSSGSSTSNGGNSKNSLGMPLKIKIMASGINRQRQNLEREVEQAALLLMTLFYGFGYVYC